MSSQKSLTEILQEQVAHASDKVQAFEDAKLGIVHAAKQYWDSYNTPGFKAGYMYTVNRLKENPHLGVKQIANDFYGTILDTQ